MFFPHTKSFKNYDLFKKKKKKKKKKKRHVFKLFVYNLSNLE